MKIIVFSDSHGRYQNLKKALELNFDADYIIHLGDGIKDIIALETLCDKKELKVVKGNYEDACFSYSAYPSCECIEIYNKKIYLCHGHRHYIKNSKHYLLDCACQNDADIVLFGHTHTRHNEYFPSDKISNILIDNERGKSKYNREKGLYLFNPGSISLPRDSLPASFGIIEIKENGVLLSHGDIHATMKK